MTYCAPAAIRTLLLSAWERTDMAVARTLSGLLASLAARPVLPRSRRNWLVLALAHWEAVTRRLLALMVLELPLLPAALPRLSSDLPAPPPLPPLPAARRWSLLFRLSEPAVRCAAPRPPAIPEAPARIRSFDEACPPPVIVPGKDDNVPADRLVARLQALMNVFDHPERHILRLRRRVARRRDLLGRMIRDVLPAAARSTSLPPDARHEAIALHQEWLRVRPAPDTS